MAGQVISRLTSSGGNDAGVHVISSSFYGVCYTAADEVNKEIIIQNRNVSRIEFTKGMLLAIKFMNKNDVTSSLPTFQLFKNNSASNNMPSKGEALANAQPVFAQQNSTIKPTWSAGSVVTFVYDTYTRHNQDGTFSTVGCWIKTAGISDEIFENLNIKIDNVESASTIAIDNVTQRVDKVESDMVQAAIVGDIEFIYWPMDSTETPPVTPAVSYDWEETFNVECEWSTDALPYVFGLDIWQRTKSFTIGNASNPTYSDPIRISGRDGAKGDKGDQGEPGTTGSPAYSYDLVTDVTSLTRNINTSPVVNNPNSIIFSATKTEGNNAPINYSGQLAVSEYVYDNSTSKWVWRQLREKSLMDSQSIEITPSIAATLVRGILFTVDGTTQLDSQTIPIIETGLNGSDGEDGNDAIIAYLTNESHSFAATASAAVTASVSSQFIINQGGQELQAAIEGILADPVTLPAVTAEALTATYAGNTFTISINPNFTTTAYSHSGTFSVSAIASVNGSERTFIKDFSWSLVPAGVDGENGVNVSNVKLYKIAMSAPGKPTGDITYNFNDQTVTGSLDGWSISVPDMATATAGASCYLISANVLAPANQNTDVIKANEWNGPITYTKNGKDGTNGTNGLDAYNRASISLYQRSSTTPAEPTASINYTFSTGTLTPSDALGNWTTGVTAAVDGEPCWVINANAISNSAVYTITDWSDPVIFTRDGADGEGVSITNREIHYIESNSGTVTPADDAQWEITVPSVTEGNYLWTRTRVTYSDGNALTSYSVAKQGEGITVVNSSIEYATNNSTITPTSGWQNTPPSTTPGWYIWTKTTTNYSDGSAVASYSVGKTGINGSNAYLYELHCSPSVIMFDQNATTPAFTPTSVTLSATRTDGNNTPAAYAGRFKLEWSNNNSTWTAVATNGNSNVSSWTQSIASVSTAATSFKATLYAANSTTNILDTETIPVIRGGKNGINGYNQSTVYLYKRSDSNTQPTKPSNSHTYNFTNKTFTDATDNKIEDWTINKIPAADGDKIAWMIFAVASSTTSTDEITSTEWSTPVKIEGVDGQPGQPGADGYNQTVVQLYQRHSHQNENDKPTKPNDNTLTYTFDTNTLTPINSLNGWSQQIPASNGLPCWITVGVARSQGNSDVIDSWSDPVIYNKDGTDGYNKATIYLYKRAENIPTEGNAKPSGQLTYTFETETLAPANSLNGWSQEIPTTDTTLWMIAAVANSTNSTDTIEVNDWSTPIQMEGINGQPGEDGFNQATIDLYKRADSAPTSSMPGELTYTFGATNPLSTPQNNWSQTIPATNGQPCWVTSGTAVSRNTSARISNWSTPTKMLEDSINVVIDNDNVTFPTTNGAATKTTVTCNIKAFKGLTQVPCTIGSISGIVTGITASSTNGTTSTPTAKVTITASNTTSTLLTTEQGTLTIPVTISGVTDSINKQFTWSLAKNGLNQATVYLYKRADSATKPSSGNDSVYNFTNKTLTNIPSGWSTTFPEETQGSITPVWVMTAVASSNTNTDNIAYTEWSTPVRYVSSGSNGQPGKDGEDAYNQADIFLYRRSIDTPVKPVFSNLTYTFSTGVSGLATSYTTNASPSVTWYTSVTAATVTSGNSKNDYMPCWMATTHPVSQSASVTVTNTWSDPAIFIQPGKGIANVVEYYLATTASTGITTASSGWETSLSDAQISATIPYLWNYEVTEYTDGNSRIIAPHIVATYGKDGKNGTSVTITSIKYGKSSSASTEPSDWYNETDWASQSIGTGTWIWVKTTYSNSSTSINKSYVGTNGTNGQPGAPGTSSYTHIAWANSDSDWTKDSTKASGKLYLGICINNTQSDSSLTYSNYTWSLIQGKSIVSVVNKYKRTTTATRPATTDDGWITPDSNTPIPTVDSTNKYLWTYEVTTYQNPTDVESTQPHLIGAYGDNGIGVTDIIEQAILWDFDGTDPNHPGPTNDDTTIVWSPRASVVWQSDKYIWVRTKIEWSDSHTSYVGPTLAKNDNNIGENINNIEENVDNIGNRSVAYSGTCSSSASAAEKVVTCTNFPALAAGVTVTVRFSIANTKADDSALTLNVNSTGAKTICVNGANTSSSNQLLWAANANISFTYDGTYWRVNSEPRSWYGTCSTEASAKTKATTINEAVICKGTNVTLNMTDTNTNTSATLNVSSTGEKNIYYGTTTTRPTTGDSGNGYGWTAASTVTFVFDGQNWRLGDTSALAGVIKAANDLGTYITSNNTAIENLQNQIDNQLEIWYGTADPTTSSTPASNWDTNNLKEAHIGDMYYNTTNGKVFQWIKEDNTYKWNEIEDEAAANALAAAQNAQTTADGRCKVFIAEEDADSATGWTEPTPPYDIGDIWILGTEIWYAKNKKDENEAFDISDWELSAKDNNAAIEELSKQFIISTVQLWYACNNDNFSDAPLNFINIESSTSDEIYEQWTPKIPAYNRQYPYYYYCYQYEFNDGTYNWSKVVQDISKTEYMNYLWTLEDLAKDTKDMLDKTNQHFYADDHGAHVIATDSDLNTLWNSAGLLFQDSTIPLLHLGARNNIGLTIYDGLGNGEENIVSSFVKDRIQLGSMLATSNSSYITITPTQMTFWNNNQQLAYAAGNNFYMPNATINSALNLKNWAWIPRSNGNLSLKWMG